MTAPKDKPNANAVKKLSRKETKILLIELLNLFGLQILLPGKLKPKFKSTAKTKAAKVEPNEKYKNDSLLSIIDYLRVLIKYQLLDIDALTREIKMFKKICKDNNIDIDYRG